MSIEKPVSGLTRRDFLGRLAGAAALPLAGLPAFGGAAAAPVSDVYFVRDIPDDPYYLGIRKGLHSGLDTLLHLMGRRGLKFYHSAATDELSGPDGLIGSDDVILVKVNAQWKYRGTTNSDLVRGLVRRLLAHPDGFTGEVVIVENGQGRGGLGNDVVGSGYPDGGVHANANDERHSFTYLVERVFRDPRVSAYLFDPIRSRFLIAGDHATDGYRVFENVSYPCFTTAGGRRVELGRGVWTGRAFRRNLKLINVPVLKHHDTGGSELTASVKHMYGLVSMKDGQSGFRHYRGLGETCGKMMASVCAPVLNILDAVWVSHKSLTGYPASTTRRLNRIAASRDPVALDAWAARNFLYAIDHNLRHRNDHPNVDAWLSQAAETINARGGLHDHEGRVVASRVTKRLEEIRVRGAHAGDYLTMP